MPNDQRMNGARSIGIRIALRESLAQLARRVARCVVLAREPPDPELQGLWKRRVGIVEIIEERLAAQIEPPDVAAESRSCRKHLDAARAALGHRSLPASVTLCGVGEKTQD